METEEKTKITVRTTINGPVERIWKLWTTPEDIIHWNNASEDWHTPKATNDLRVGGKFTSRMEAKDGSEGFDFEGIYDEVALHRKISYTIGDGRKVSVIFSAVNGGTEIIETFETENENPIEMQRGGWQAILDNFKKYASESRRPVKPGIITSKIAPCLWFDHNAEEAVDFYLGIFNNSGIDNINRYNKEGYEIHGMEDGTVLAINFHLDGMPLTALNGGPIFKFNEALSLQIFCDDQEEIDYYWNKLLEGGEESMCGWLKDKFGLSWQVVPSILSSLLMDPNKAPGVTKALMQMRKLDIEALMRAARV